MNKALTLGVSASFAAALGIVAANTLDDPAPATQLIPPLVETYVYPDSVNSSRIACMEDDPCWVPDDVGYTCFVGDDGQLHAYLENSILPEGHHLIYCP